MKTPALPLGLLTGLTLLFAGCASGPGVGSLGRTPAAGVVINYPPPPDPARIQFLAALTSEGDLRRGEAGGRSLVRPYGVAAASGTIFVCDVAAGVVMVLDARDRGFDVVRPGGEARLQSPVNCDVDPANGDIYIVDSGRGDVVVVDSLMQYVGNIPVEGGRAGDVVVDGDSVWVSDVELGKIALFDKATRAEVRRIPEYERGSDEGLTVPYNFTVSRDRIFVSNFGRFNVQVYDRDGAYLRTIGSFGRAIGQFVRNKGIAVDRDGHLYVVDAAFNNVQIFTENGELLMSFGGPYSGMGGMYLPAGVSVSYDPMLLEAFAGHAADGSEFEYLILVTNQFGPDLVNVYGFLKGADGGG